MGIFSPSAPHRSLSHWYTLDGRRLTGRPTQKGIFVNNGVKMINH